MNLYLRHNIVRKFRDGMGIYRCFQSLKNDLYYIQSLDILYPDKNKNDFHFFNNQEVELFVEDDISETKKGYSTISEAIDAFDTELELLRD